MNGMSPVAAGVETAVAARPGSRHVLESGSTSLPYRGMVDKQTWPRVTRKQATGVRGHETSIKAVAEPLGRSERQ